MSHSETEQTIALIRKISMDKTLVMSHILQGVNFSIGNGEIVSLLGRNIVSGTKAHHRFADLTPGLCHGSQPDRL